LTLIARARLIRVVIAVSPRIFDAGPLAKLLPSPLPMSFEIVFGRWLALCAHPVCAWRGRGIAARLLVVTSYVAAGYLSVLTALLAW
jgi:hypothetical protein